MEEENEFFIKRGKKINVLNQKEINKYILDEFMMDEDVIEESDDDGFYN